MAKLEFDCQVSDLSIKGEHNIANAMAALGAAKLFNLDNVKIIKGIQIV